MAEWLRNGLQNRVHQFNSGRGLQLNLLSEYFNSGSVAQKRFAYRFATISSCGSFRGAADSAASVVLFGSSALQLFRSVTSRANSSCACLFVPVNERYRRLRLPVCGSGPAENDAPGNVPVTIEQILDPELVGSGTGQKSK